jgi:hypothetical protein
MAKKLTQEEYLARCTDSHGTKYGLQHIVYTTTTAKVKVECYEHGIFEVHAGTFMRGTGCAKCAYEQNGLKRRTTQEGFIEQSKKIHNGAYDYRYVEYVRGDLKVKILCNSCCALFEMTPEAHIAGQGCRSCGYARNGANKWISFDKFVSDSKEYHGTKFNYEHIRDIWCGIKTQFSLFCPVHQTHFKTIAETHSSGADCPACAKIVGGIKNRGNTTKFIEDGIKKFSNKFDYTKVDYVKNNLKVEIRCVEHDRWFKVAPNAHLHPDSIGGCPECTKAGYSTAKAGYLYVLNADDITKVGITNRNPTARCKSVSRESFKKFEVLKAYFLEDGEIPRSVETLILRELKQQYKQPTEKFDGYKECFYNVNQAALLNRIESLIKEQYSS